MPVIDFLRSTRGLYERIQKQRDKVADLKTMAAAGGGMDYSRERVQTSLSGSRLEEDVCNYVEEEEALYEAVHELCRRRAIIHYLCGEYAPAVLLRWIEGKTYREIGAELHVGTMTAWRMERKGIARMKGVGYGKCAIPTVQNEEAEGAGPTEGL